MQVKKLTADEILAVFEAASRDIEHALACKLGDDSLSKGLKLIPWGSTLVDTIYIPDKMRDQAKKENCPLEDVHANPVMANLLTNILRHALKSGLGSYASDLPEYKVYLEE